MIFSFNKTIQDIDPYCIIIYNIANNPLRLYIMRTLASFSLIINLLKVFIMKKAKTYMDKLMENKEFREKFDKEYQNLCVTEKIAEIRHRADLRQDTPVNRRRNNKSL